MNNPQNRSSTGRQCPQCGAELPGDLPSELCPKCLLKAGLATEPKAGPTGTVIVASEHPSRGLPEPGEELGHYRIVRSLGSGGMGAVFEAEDRETGRRIALKVLSQALDSLEARQRFFREGRLAASINHPNSVYIFGTEEIGGIPLIAMELVGGGTLEDHVRSNGPMPVAEAVDAALQIIAGLEAAQRTGILHRDVKPSNCFVDVDSTVKIGDFGLSISTAIRTEPALTARGVFLGTPAFCSPEQLRGQELNARSDMYSVGATLFYLLTGHTPFEAKNVVALLATVLEQPAPSPRHFRPNLPRGLSNAVRRCLEKQPGERYKNYEELRKALAPYSSTAPVPATLGLRFLAGLADACITALLGMIISTAAASLKTHIPLTLATLPDLLDATVRQSLGISLGIWIVWVLYYALPEGIWGFTVGKLAFGLRVVRQDNNLPGFWRALPRPLIYLVGTSIVEILVYGLNPASSPSISAYSTWFENLLASSDFILLALLFSTVRRGNGFAAIHDLVTKTRVVAKIAVQTRPAPGANEASPPAIKANPLIGPYHIIETIGASAGTAWLLGYDLRLLRKVWIRTVPAGTPPVAAPLRNLGRVGRLRWLAGRRSPEENWDAFEALSGQPLLHLLQNPQPWTQVRFWLYDLATELSAAQKDGSRPPVLALDRVWITNDGRAKLLDFPAPGIPVSPGDVITSSAPNHNDAPRFLGQIAAAALEGRTAAAAKPVSEVSVPLPMHVREFFKSLPRLSDVDTLLLALRSLSQRVAVVTRRRRAAILAGCIAFPLSIACLVLVAGMILKQWERHNQAFSELSQLLSYRAGMQSMDKTKSAVPTDRQFAIYIATHCRAAITNTLALDLINDKDRRFARESLAQYPAPTASEIAEANAALLESQARWEISAGEIKDASAFVDRLRRRSDPVSAFLWNSLSNQDQAALLNFQPSASGSNQVFQIIDRVIIAPGFYDADRFKGVSLRPETIWVMKQNPANSNLVWIKTYLLNRLLLEDAYPGALSKIQFTPGFVGPLALLMQPSFPWIALAVMLVLCVCLPALIAALVFRGGLVLFVSGVTFMRRDGLRASRGRLFWRALITWSLLLAAPVFLWHRGNLAWAALAVGLFCGLAILSVTLPQRGLQDRLAGTWPVPR